MKCQSKEAKRQRMFVAVQRYIVFFALNAFFITCCMLLFLNQLQRSLNVEYTVDNLRSAAVLTFGNVVLLSLIFTLIDGLRRRYMVERPVKRIISAAEKMMNGEFSTRN